MRAPFVRPHSSPCMLTAIDVYSFNFMEFLADYLKASIFPLHSLDLHYSYPQTEDFSFGPSTDSAIKIVTVCAWVI